MSSGQTRRNVSAGTLRGAARAFSLMEVMIVIVIILLISGIVAVNLFSARDTATERTAKIQLSELKDGLRFFNLEFNRYPTVDEGIAVLWTKDNLDAEADESKWRMFFDDAIPTDPWGSEWGYTDESDEGHPFELWSYGPDEEDGTDDDISIWSDSEEDDLGDLPSSTSDG